MNPNVICIFNSVDCGKSLLKYIFMENFEDYIFDNTRSDMDGNRERALSRMTEKPYMLVQMQPGWWKNHGHYGIHMTRDIRARWAVTGHRHFGIKSFANEMKKSINDFDNLKEPRLSQMLTLRFEDYISDQMYWFEKIAAYCSLPIEHQYKAASDQYNDWFSTVDLVNIHRYVDDGKSLLQKELDYISDAFADYHTKYEYPERLTIADLYPETLLQDINQREFKL